MPLSAGDKLGPYENLAPIGAGVQQIVRKCLAKLPAERFQTVADLKRALEQAANQARSGSRPSQCCPLPT
jgi:hypothetical protein